MTRSSQPVREHISDFEGDFERTLRRKKKLQESNPPSPEPELEEQEVEVEEKATTQVGGEEQGIAMDNRTLKELAASGLDNAAPLCIQYPMAAQGKTEEFELKSSLLHHIPKFHGLSMEDPNKHLKEFEVVCSSMTPVTVDGSILKMKAFPFSLMDKAKDWLYELAPGTVTSWESMKRAFLEKFFPTSRIILLRKKISGIQQSQGESFPSYYERFKSLVASCPQHQMKEELLLQYFYEGLLPLERQMLDASAGGALVDKTPRDAKTLITNRALNAQQYEGVGQRDTPRPHHVNELVEGPKTQGTTICGVCSIQGHQSDQCPQLIENGGWESANAVGYGNQNQPRNDPFSNTYNPGWRDHPNFRWRDAPQYGQQSGFQQPPSFFPRPMEPQPPPQAQSSQTNPGTSMNDDKTYQLLTTMAQGMQNQAKEVNELKKQMGQMAEFLGQLRENGKLPSTTVVNPKGGFESAKAITLRSGKEVRNKEDEKIQLEEDENTYPTTRVPSPMPQPSKTSHPSTSGKNVPNVVISNTNLPNVPFPSRFLQSKNEEEEKDVLETFRKVHVNIPLLDAIKQIPKYAKCLKKLCTAKKRVREKEVVHVSENVSAILQHKLPPKCKDPGSFTIPCVIGNTHFKSAMLDLGASINVMPYSIYASMNLGALKNDGVIIQLADRSNAYPKGVLEDVLVQVDHLIFPADFYVLEMDESDHAPSLPILLGRPFMKTAQTKIDVAKGLVTMAFGGDMISFKISESIETPNVVHSCCAIGKIEKIRPDHSAPSTKDASRTMQDEGIGVEYKDHTATAVKMLKVAESTMGKNVHIAATSSHHIGKPPNPNPMPFKVDRWFPSLVQVPKQIPDGGRMNMNLRQHNINKHHYPFPFKDVIYENFVEHVVEDIPLHAVGSKEK
ncbi:hypothetical protein ACFX2A_041560 [Malus domestica]